VTPHNALWVIRPSANSGVVVLQCMMAPPSSSRLTVGAETAVRLSLQILDPKVVISFTTGWKSVSVAAAAPDIPLDCFVF